MTKGIPSADPTLRFAPSPNGRLHLGHAYSALVNRDMADRLGGTLLLRIEDIDPVRCTRELEAMMLDDLDWLGIRFDAPPVRQSERGALYGDTLERLREMGLAYPAFLSRGEVRRMVARDPDWPRDPDGAPHYPPDERTVTPEKAARRIADGAPHAWRLNVEEATQRAGWSRWTETDVADQIRREVEDDPRAWGDVVLRRVDGAPAYHLAATVDDAAQGITHVVRGRDLARATAVHALLRTLLGLSAPLYHHHALIERDGAKLAKSRGDGERDWGLNALRAAGVTPDDARRMALGLAQQARNATEST